MLHSATTLEKQTLGLVKERFLTIIQKYHRSDKMSSITEKGQMESTSDEGFNSGGQTTNSSPDVSQKKQRRRKQRRRENKKDGTGSIKRNMKIILTFFASG